MILGMIQLRAPYAPGSGVIVTDDLTNTLNELDAFPSRVRLYKQSNLNVYTGYLVTSAGGSRITLGSVVEGTDQAFSPGDLVWFQSNLKDVPAGAGSGTIQSGSAGQLAGYSASGTTVGGLTLGTNLSITSGTLNAAGGGGSGTVTTVSIVSANGLAGTVSNATSTPAITLSTPISGILKGTGTAIADAIADTDYQSPLTLTTTGSSGAATFSGHTLNIPQYSGGGGSGTVSSGTSSQLAYYSGSGTTVGGLTLGTNLSITSGTINATAGSGSGTVSSGTSDQVAYYSGAGTTVGGLTLDGNQVISAGTLSKVGGLQVDFANTTARNALPNAQRLEGMLAYTQDTKTYWTLLPSPWGGTNSDWVQAGPLEIAEGGTVESQRGTINFIDGTNVTVTVADNSGSDRADITIGTPTTGLEITQFYGAITADTDGATITFDLATSDWHSVVLGGNRTLAVTGPAVGQQFALRLAQDGTGSRTVTWFSMIAEPSAGMPALQTAANAIDIFAFKCVASGEYDFLYHSAILPPSGGISPSFASGLVSYWKFDESSPSGTTNRADSVDSNTLTPVNGVYANAGQIGQAADFTISGYCYLDVTTATNLDVAGGTFYLCARFKVLTMPAGSGISYWGFIGGRANSGGSIIDYAIGVNPSGTVTFRTGDATGDINELDTTATVGVDGIWHVAIAYYNHSSNVMGLSLDGASFITATPSHTVASDGASATFSCGSTLGGEFHQFQGYLDAFGVGTGYVPTNTDAAAFWNSGNGYDPV